MALSVSYWSSPMEKLILHLSPVARRRTLKNSNQSTNKNSQSLGRHYARHRNRSEPQSRVSTSMKNVSNIGACNSQAQVNLNSSTEEETVKNPLDCDVKTLRLYSIQKVSKMSRDYVLVILATFGTKSVSVVSCMQLCRIDMARLTLSIWYKKGSLAFDNIQFRCSLPLGHRHGNRPLKVGLGNDEDK